ncbi:uncharacterized protein BDCG_00184 [Blastomyces dermatitidis ER-3]|uniref:Uncharacterized protein n=1 Tax=Ajellomyces dermatitidis (strain ER-3 / ATCC MYA-2586) TaxID=559297 RepID=A0ABP2EJW3_AJEDR|nr:uncharacterized protein BDCG_00184 [Blastomyces dermatitidis ER-3]EEQ83379.2 hypothetical protein BDCG_00184 [Blastomyces dermatitidis ER-3]
MTTTAISAKLSELENVIRAAGDSEVGDYLSNIRQSPNQLSSLRRALLKRPKRDETYSKRHSWCSQFRSQSGKWLSKKQVDDLSAYAVVWSVDPQDFCEGVALDSSIIRRCYNDLIRIRDDSSGRIVLLIVMSEKVEEAQQYIHAKKSIRNRSRTKKSAEDISLRNTEILTSSLRDLTKQLWGDLEEEEEKQQKRNNISLFSRTHKQAWVSIKAYYFQRQWLRQYSPSPTASGLGAQPGRSLETDLDLDSFSTFLQHGDVPLTSQANIFATTLDPDLDSFSTFPQYAATSGILTPQTDAFPAAPNLNLDSFSDFPQYGVVPATSGILTPHLDSFSDFPQYGVVPATSGTSMQQTDAFSAVPTLNLDSFSAFPRYGSVPTTPQANTFPAALNLDLDSSSAFTNLPHIPPIANESFYQT